MIESYQWIKAFHLISVIAWMAGMLYLPRLFVYHCAAAAGSEMSETLKVMERRLLRGIMNPAMGLTWIFGLWLLYISEAWREGADEYATVALKYESRDVTRDRATCSIVSGDDAVTTTTELWTFVRTNGRAWRVSAIQEA